MNDRSKADSKCSHTKDWSAADELCRNLVKDCTGLLTWEPVTKYALEGALRAHRELHKSTDDIWIDLALTYMRVCVVHAGAGEAEELGRVLAGFRDVKSTTSGEPLHGFTLVIWSSPTDSVRSQSLSCARLE